MLAALISAAGGLSGSGSASLGRQGFLAFARREKEVGLDAMLLRIQVVVASPSGVKFLVRTALDNPASLDYQNLIGAPDRGQPMGDYERGASLHEISQAFLDHRFGF